jgi:hypothetical protein
MNLITQQYYFSLSGTSDDRRWQVPVNGRLIYVDFSLYAYLAAAATGGISGIINVTKNSVQNFSFDCDNVICGTRCLGWKIAAGGELPGLSMLKFCRLDIPVRALENIYVHGAAATNTAIDGVVVLGMLPDA